MKTARKRNRHAEGWVELDKTRSPHMWKARYLDWTKTKVDASGRIRAAQRSVVLGAKKKGELETLSSAKAAWNRIRWKYLTHAEAGNVLVPTFEEYVWGTFHPTRSRLRRWRPATDRRFRYDMDKVLPRIGHKRLNAISTVEMQGILIDLAQTYGHDTVASTLSYLRAIFREANEADLILKDPARRLQMPVTREPSRPYTTLNQVVALEQSLSGRDLIALKLFSRCALRAGEVFGLRWGDIQPNQTLQVRRSFSKGIIGPPKTKESKKPILIPLELYEELQRLRITSEDPSTEGWIFPAARKRGEASMPTSSANWLKRVLKPAASKLGFEITLHMLRRGFATMASQAGAMPKDIQRQMRHSRASTTADIYIQPVEESVRRTVETVDERIKERLSQVADPPCQA